jgi:alpha-L-fucosidase
VQDNNHKSVRQLIQIFAETISGGGNLLLDVGPREDGTITPEQASRLRGLGAWIKRNSAAVYDTGRGLPPGHFYGASTLSLDRRTLYLISFDRPAEYVSVRGLRSSVRRAFVLSTGAELPVRATGGLGEVPGVTYISVPAAELDEYATVIALELDGELGLYRGSGRELSARTTVVLAVRPRPGCGPRRRRLRSWTSRRGRRGGVRQRRGTTWPGAGCSG